MSFDERLKILRIQAGLSQKALAKQIGVDPYAMHRMEKGSRPPDADTLIGLRTHYGIDINEFLCGEDRSSVMGGIPLYDCEELSKPVEDRVASQWISHPDLPEECFAWRIRDNSMFPTLSNGDIVIVSGCPTKTGDLILCRDETGKYMVRRIQCPDETEQMAVPENDDYASTPLSAIAIIGKVELYLKLESC